MKRTFIKAALYLLAGMLLAVLSTWLCAILVDPFKNQHDFTRVRTALLNLRGSDNQGMGQMTVMSHRDFGMRRIAASCNRAPPPWGPGPDGVLEEQEHGDLHALAPTWSGLDQPTAEYLAGKFMFERRVVDMRGWPLPCMWHMAGHLTMIDTKSGIQERQAIGGLALSPPLPMWKDLKPYSSQPDEPRTLPLRIMPMSFALNTIFYALLAYLIILLPGATRRLVRRRRGQCPACGYLRGAGAICTECGTSSDPHLIPLK